MSIKTIDPDYEGYAGVPRQRSAYTGGAWYVTTCIDIGRAKREVSARQVEESIAWPKPRGLNGGRSKGELTLILHQYILENGPGTAVQIAKQIGEEAYKLQNIFQRNTDLFVKLARGKYGARRISG